MGLSEKEVRVKGKRFEHAEMLGARLYVVMGDSQPSVPVQQGDGKVIRGERV